jgi:hypothetical protein
VEFQVTPEGLRLIAGRSRTLDRARCAIVAPLPTGFGLGRMYEAFCNLLGDFNVAVFRDFTSARAWLEAAV